MPVERDSAHGDRGHHRAGVHRRRPVPGEEEHAVAERDEDGQPREEADRTPRDRREPAHRYACVADQVNVALAARPWKALSPESVPVVGSETWK